MLPIPQKRKTNAFAELPAYMKVDVSNQNRLSALEEQGLLDDFEKYRNRGTLWENVKNAGSGVLDILNRGEYATAAALKETWGGDPGVSSEEAGRAVKEAGRELFSGVGGIKGNKPTFGEVVREKSPGYAQFSEEHPIASIGTDLALSVGLDPTTYMGGAIYKGVKAGLKPVGKALAPVGKALSETKLVDGLANTFIAGHGWKKQGEAGVKAYNIIKDTENFTGALLSRYSKKLKDTVVALSDNFGGDTQKVKNFILAGYGDTLPEEIKAIKELPKRAAVKSEYYRKLFGDDFGDAVASMDTFRLMGRRTAKYTGKGTDWMLADYVPNNYKALTELMENAGEYVGSGHARAQALTRQMFERGKTLKTGQDFLDWAAAVGIKDDDLGKALAINFQRRIGADVNYLRQVITQQRLLKEVPELFRPLETGTDTVVKLSKEGIPLVEKGETLWMPMGNLRFYQQSLGDAIPASFFDDIISNGSLTQSQYQTLVEAVGKLQGKTVVGVSKQVPVYAVPVDVAKELMRTSKNLANQEEMVKWYDKMLFHFKANAILSPFFHVRNFVSSMSQNYLADMNPVRAGDAMRFVSDSVLGKKGSYAGLSHDVWQEMGQRFGILGRGFTSMTEEYKTLPGLQQIYDANHAIGTHVEDINRMALFMDRVAKDTRKTGLQRFADAARDVKKFHFDYQELTDFERNFARRAMPFYAWLRKNTAFQMRMVIDKPGKYRGIQKLKEAIAGDAESQNNPDWWRDQDVWDIKGGKFAYQVGLPYADLNAGGGGSPVGTLGPLGSAYNLLQNYDPFRQRAIKEFKGQQEPVIAGKISFPVISDPKVKYAVESALPTLKRYGFDLSESLYNVLSGNDPDGVSKLKAMKTVLGFGLMKKVKTQQERNRVYRLQEELENYRRYLEQQQGRGR